MIPLSPYKQHLASVHNTGYQLSRDFPVYLKLDRKATPRSGSYPRHRPPVTPLPPAHRSAIKCPLSSPPRPNTSQPVDLCTCCPLCPQCYSHQSTCFASSLAHSHPVGLNLHITTSERGLPQSPRQNKPSSHGLLSDLVYAFIFQSRYSLQPLRVFFFFSLFHFSVTCLFIIRLSMSSTRTKTTCLMTMFSCHQHSARHTGGVQRLLTIEQVSCVICKMTAPGASKMSPQERKKK